jgi:hypothetical protein
MDYLLFAVIIKIILQIVPSRAGIFSDRPLCHFVPDPLERQDLPAAQHRAELSGSRARHLRFD